MVPPVHEGRETSESVESLSDEQRGHLFRVLGAQDGLVSRKYSAGQKEHGGNCWEKPGMLAHALDECADLPVYLWTLREQLTALAYKCEQTGRPDLADDILRLMRK